MEDLAYLLVPFAQIAFGAATIGSIILGMDDKKTKLKAYLVPIVIWGWILAAIGTAALPIYIKSTYRDPDTVPNWMPYSVPSLLIYGALIGMTFGTIIGAILGRRRWNRWKTELPVNNSTETPTTL